MKLYCSQNLFGIVIFDDFEPVDYIFLGIHSNGIARKNSSLYIADYSDVVEIDDNGNIKRKIHHDGYDNIHTLFFDGDDMLISSTGNNTSFRNDEVILKYPRDHYHNSLIPWDEYYIIGLRGPKTVLLYNKRDNKVEKEIRLPFLRNMHSPTHYKGDTFLVSDGDGVVMFDMEGHFIKKSPKMDWPRGIKVVDELAYVVDRNTIYEWDVENNTIVRSAKNPVSSAVEGAFFDVVVS